MTETQSSATDMDSQPPDFDIGCSAEGEELALLADDFCRELRLIGVDVAAETPPAGQIKASVDWVIPTAVAVFIAHKYLGTLLEEAAKDHYSRLKSAFKRLARRTTGQGREVKVTVVSAGKAIDTDPAVFSVWAALRDSRRVVFRFEHTMSSDDLDGAIDSLFELLTANTRGVAGNDILNIAPSAFPMSKSAPVIMLFDSAAGRWRAWVVDGRGVGHPYSDDAA